MRLLYPALLSKKRMNFSFTKRRQPTLPRLYGLQPGRDHAANLNRPLSDFHEPAIALRAGHIGVLRKNTKPMLLEIRKARDAYGALFSVDLKLFGAMEKMNPRFFWLHVLICGN